MENDALENISKALIIILSLCILIYSCSKNKDMFSPIKIYLLYSVFFYMGIYFTKVSYLTIFSYFTLIASIGIISIFEPPFQHKDIIKQRSKNNYLIKTYLIIWMLSIPGIIIKLFFIQEAGGIYEYLFSLAFRVEAWAGKGHLTIWFQILPVLNLAYFCLIISDAKLTKTKLFFFFAHFISFLTIGMLTGSRSFIVLTLLGMIILFTYIRNKIPFKWIFTFATILILLGGIIGAARNEFGSMNEESFFQNATSTEKYENTQLSYGIIPLEIVFNSPDRPLLYGETYFSLITNFIPRQIYTSKPDTGGIAFTKIYTNNQWDGLSNLATGSITEGIINFGKPIGLLIGVLLNFLVLAWGCFMYKITINQKRSDSQLKKIIYTVIYFYIILTAARFSFAEFTDIFQTLIFNAIIPLLMIRRLTEWKFSLK